MGRALGVCVVVLGLLWRAGSPTPGPLESRPLRPGPSTASLAGAPGGELAMPGGRPARSNGPLVVTAPTSATSPTSPTSATSPTSGPAQPASGPVGVACGRGPAAPVADLARTGTPAEFVTLAYCLLLHRLPDEEGLAYWSEQIEGGLDRVDVVRELVGSPEYQARGVRPYHQALELLTLAPEAAAGRWEQAAQTEIGESRRAETAAGTPGLRIRAEIDRQEFERWVGGQALQEPAWVTDAVVHGRLVGDGQRVNVAYVHLSATRGVSVSPGDRGRAVVGSWAAEIGATVAVNGNWYGPWDGPAVSGGVAYGGDDHGYTALLGFTAAGDAVVEHHRAVNDGVDDRIVEGVSGHPTLIHRGEPTVDFGGDPTFTERHPRTAIGLDRSGDVLILVTVDGRSATARGATGAETVELLVALGAHDAVMLDGGGSSTMWIAGQGVVNQPSGGLRAVGNELAVFGD